MTCPPARYLRLPFRLGNRRNRGTSFLDMALAPPRTGDGRGGTPLPPPGRAGSPGSPPGPPAGEDRKALQTLVPPLLPRIPAGCDGALRCLFAIPEVLRRGRRLPRAVPFESPPPQEGPSCRERAHSERYPRILCDFISRIWRNHMKSFYHRRNSQLRPSSQ